ncbi:MAG: hypothetical protein Q9184_001742 [Pyrenodesmia sp. 2 TL-2023]
MTPTGPITTSELLEEVRNLRRKGMRLQIDLDEMTEWRDKAVKALESTMLSSIPEQAVKQLEETNDQLMKLLSQANERMCALGNDAPERCDKLKRDREEALKSLCEQKQEADSLVDQLAHLMNQNNDLRERKEELENELWLARPQSSSTDQGTGQPPVDSEERRQQRVRALAAKAAFSAPESSTEPPPTQQKARQPASALAPTPAPTPASARRAMEKESMALAKEVARLRFQSQGPAEQPAPQQTLQPPSTPAPAPPPVVTEQPASTPTLAPASARRLTEEERMERAKEAARLRFQSQGPKKHPVLQPTPSPTAEPHVKKDQDQSLQPGTPELERSLALLPRDKGKGKEHQPAKPEPPIPQSESTSQPEAKLTGPQEAAVGSTALPNPSTGKTYATAAKVETPEESQARLIAAKENSLWESLLLPGKIFSWKQNMRGASPVPVPEPTLSSIPGTSRSQSPSPDASARQTVPVPRPPPHKSSTLQGKSRLIES